MKKINWVKKCLFAAAVAATPAAVSVASAEDLWKPYLEFENRGNEFRYTAQANVFAPVVQNDSTLVFADVRGQVTDQSTSEGNFGVAVRTILDNDMILGAYGFYDIKESTFGNTFHQGVAGLELLTVDSGLRMNGYIPDQSTQFTGAAGAVIQGGNIFVQAGVEAAYWGIDVEYEKRIFRKAGSYGDCCDDTTPSWSPDVELWASAGVFHFDNNNAGFQGITGPRIRTELRLFDLPLLGNDSRLVFAGVYEYDDIRDSVGTGLINVRIPFGKGGSNRSQRLRGLERRMVTPIVRDVDVVTQSVGGSLEQAVVAGTGGNIAVIDATTANPEMAIANAGANSVVFANGSNGVINTGGTINMAAGQQLLGAGGGQTVQVVGATTGTQVAVNVPGARPTINTGNAMAGIFAGDGSRIQGVDIASANPGGATIAAFASPNVVVDDVNVTVTSPDGGGIILRQGSSMTLSNSTVSLTDTTSAGFAPAFQAAENSQVTITNSTLRTAGEGDIAFNLRDSSTARVLDSNIATTGRANAITVDDNSQSVFSNTTISTTAVDASGLRLVRNAHTRVIGGSITTQGDMAEGVSASNDAKFALENVAIRTGNAGAMTGNAAHGVSTTGDVQFSISGGTIDATFGGNTIPTFTHGVLVQANPGQNAVFSIDGAAFTSPFGNNIFADANLGTGGGTIDATVTNNQLTSTVNNPFFGSVFTTAGTGVIDLNFSGNTLTGPQIDVNLQEENAGLNVVQGAPGSGMNGIDTVNGAAPADFSINLGAGAPPNFGQPAGNVATPMAPTTPAP